MFEIHSLVGKKVFSVRGNTLVDNVYTPLQIVFEGGGSMTIDAGTFMHPEESQLHILGQHVCKIVERIVPYIHTK